MGLEWKMIWSGHFREEKSLLIGRLARAISLSSLTDV
jgi:hypothetical protein